MMRGNGQSDRNLSLVVQCASALSLGTLAAVLYSVKAVTPEIRVVFSFATLISFVLAAGASVAFWHVVFILSRGGTVADAADGKAPAARANRMWLVILATMLALALVAAFIYPLKDFSREKVSEIGSGAFVALGFLGVLGVLFWRVVRYLEQ